MLNTLFVWAKLYPKTSYRQGMNELLAVIVLIVHPMPCQGKTAATPCRQRSNQQKKTGCETTQTAQVRSSAFYFVQASDLFLSILFLSSPSSSESILSTVLSLHS